MEEILASIRRIISEDSGRETGSAMRPAGMPAAEVGQSKESKEDVLELTDVVLEDGTVRRLEKEPLASSAVKPPQLHAPELVKGPGASKAAEEVVPPMTTVTTSQGDDRLLSEVTAAASVTMFSQLANLVERQELPQSNVPLGAGARTLEGLVTELLRPYLREWLDRNLPGIIERLVRQEIEKLVRRGEGR